jgi:hypothetical protein
MISNSRCNLSPTLYYNQCNVIPNCVLLPLIMFNQRQTLHSVGTIRVN